MEGGGGGGERRMQVLSLEGMSLVTLNDIFGNLR